MKILASHYKMYVIARYLKSMHRKKYKISVPPPMQYTLWPHCKANQALIYTAVCVKC